MADSYTLFFILLVTDLFWIISWHGLCGMGFRVVRYQKVFGTGRLPGPPHSLAVLVVVSGRWLCFGLDAHGSIRIEYSLRAGAIYARFLRQRLVRGVICGLVPIAGEHMLVLFFVLRFCCPGDARFEGAR